MTRIARSPGKLILSGEHSVVQGAPALVMAVNLETQVCLTPLSENVLDIQLPDRDAVRYELNELPGHLKSIRERHQKGLRISPEDLLAATAALTSPNKGGALAYTSSIPLGSGLGSSAAFILALLIVLQPTASQKELYTWAVEGESFQHGASSGLDVMASLKGGLQHFQLGEHRPLPDLKLPPFRVYHSGQPESSTGQCVALSQSVFAHTPELVSQFTSVTEAFISALNTCELDPLHRAIRENHRCLCEIGVVPTAVQESIARLESEGCSAKICGAGSVSGDAAGMIVVVGDRQESVPAHWKRYPIECNGLGTRIV